jgi:hypothetical protein
MWRQCFSCLVTLISSDSMMRIIKRSGKHSYSNQLLERKVCEAENEKIKVAAIVSTMYLETSWVR